MTARREWPAWILIAIFATVVANHAFDYSVLVPQQELRYQMHNAIVSGVAPAPERFHVLVPFVMQPIVDALETAMPPGLAFRRAYFGFHFLALITLLASLYAYGRLWFSRDQALIGTLIVATTLRVVLRQGEYWDFTPIPEPSVFAPWSLLEPSFVALGLLFLYRRRWPWLVVTLVLAALNSGIGIVVAATSASPSSILDVNLDHLPSMTVNLGLFWGATIVLAIVGYGRTPPFARRAAAFGALIGIGLLGLGQWWEVRVITPLYPVIMPLILSSMFVPAPQTRASGPS